MNDFGLIHGDALRIPLRDASVDCIITSPPYFALRSYQDDGEHYDGQIGSEPTPADFLAALWAVMDECWRVLKPTGSAFVNLGDKYDSGTAAKRVNPGTVKDGQGQGWNQGTPRYSGGNPKSLMGLPWRFALGLTCPDTYRTDGVAGPQWTLRAEIIWSKPNGLPESVTDRVRRSHEQWFHLTRGPKYYAGVDEIRQPHGQGTMTRGGGRNGLRIRPESNPSGTVERGRDEWEGGVNPLGALPGSVWSIPSEPLVVPDHVGVDHFAAFPQEWVRRLILGWSPNGICTACDKPIGAGDAARPNAARTHHVVHPGLQGGDGVQGLRDPERTSGPRPSRQGDEGVQALTSARPEAGSDPDGDPEVRREVRGLPYPSALGGGDEGAAERLETPPVLLRKGVIRQGHVPDALHEMEAPRRPARGEEARTCSCADRPPTRPSVIFDPFVGTGTVPMVARALGRFGVGLDLSRDYLRLARWRIADSRHGAKTINRTNRERQGNFW